MMTDCEGLFRAAGRDVALLEHIFDRLPDVLFYIKDRESRYVVVNWAVVQQSGVKSKENVCGRTADELFPVTGYSTWAQDMEVINSGKEIIDLLRLYFSADGGRQWCLSTKYPIRGDDGEIQGLIGISRRLPRPDENHLNYKRLDEFLKILGEDCSRKILISEVAKRVSISVDILEKLSKEIFHLTPKQLLLQMRIDRACMLLETTNLNVTEVAAECGYSDHSAFSRQFKVATHFTPRDYRNSKSA
ncbi:AraC family transcriptional regulator [Pseudomonas sp. GD03842]|uniref:AraC family transcriptional regulator n=1 Tax=unclassified Pseudomonas TaxID=196821 RepID=UPI000D38660E|nr:MULTISPECIES: AraC family transcriptional regulator [unclassified Pseudomonas]MDH0746925.1 AraC family transcriptional regulator [Pseudomonas sp. GD03842]RAU43833.1 AraC family transcriptional regulator [Pseudomonas sp. RIT 409]RAU56273.1 AraC family transcriptional regulator [Pseudomonas sp. RIT 412]